MILPSSNSKKTKTRNILISLGLVVLVINNISFFLNLFSSTFILEYYTKGYFSIITSIQRNTLGFLPFSLGDFIYLLVSIIIITNLIRITLYIIRKDYSNTKHTSINTLLTALTIWLLLGTQWNWNYLQPSIEDKMNLDTSEYSIEEVAILTRDILNKTIKLKNTNNTYDVNQIIEFSPEGYKKLGIIYPYFQYNNYSIKKSLFSSILPYLGISGYYNPFTAEAQVIDNIPHIQMPFVINHEIAHQLGIASESEANFIGYLASINNTNDFVKYSGNTSLLRYCLYDLRNHEYKNYDDVVNSIPDGIKHDLNTISEYWISHQNEYQKYTDKLYDIFLKSNNQEDGLMSYNKVVSLMIFYNRKN